MGSERRMGSRRTARGRRTEAGGGGRKEREEDQDVEQEFGSKRMDSRRTRKRAKNSLPSAGSSSPVLSGMFLLWGS